jgi:hypothetical protein
MSWKWCDLSTFSKSGLTNRELEAYIGLENKFFDSTTNLGYMSTSFSVEVL